MSQTKKPVAVFTGDNHLRPRTWIKRPDLYGDSYWSFQQIVGACKAMGLPLLLLGDLFNSDYPDAATVGFYLQQMQRMQAQNLPVFSVEGNHDKSTTSWASLAPNVQTDGSFVLGGVHFHGISFCTGPTLQAAIDAIPPETQVLLMHQSWKEIQRVGATDASLRMLPRAVTLLTGDYHVSGTYTENAVDGGFVHAYSPGSTVLQDISEAPQKYYGVLYDDLSVAWSPLQTRAVLRVSCMSEEDADTVTQLGREPVPVSPYLPDHLQKPILRIRYLDSLPEISARLTAACGERYHLFLEPTITQEVIEITPEALPRASESLEAAVVTLATTPDVRDAAVRLLREPTAAAVAAIAEEFKQRFYAAYQPQA